MRDENQEAKDNFVILQKNEITQMKQEVLDILDTIRFGNHRLEKQCERDVELLSLALIDYGFTEHHRLKADTLLKSMLLLFFSQVYYRHSQDRRFYPLDTLNTDLKNKTTLTNFPIASILLHGSRILIEFPSEMAHEIADWLIVDQNSWRYLATHHISPLKNVEVIDPKNNPSALPFYKFLKEEKVNGAQAAFHFMSDALSSKMTTYLNFPAEDTDVFGHCDRNGHYGFDLALGGVGNLHFASQKTIQNNGEHGHLYINFYPGEPKKHAGLLLGIEQSAPGQWDQFGSWHDFNINEKKYSASGGDFFCKRPDVLEIYQNDYQGLTILPFASYYDSLWSFISKDTWTLIKTSFEKCKAALSLLSREKKLSFIRDILTSSGGVNNDDFTRWFGAYSQEILQDDLLIQSEKQSSEVKHIQLQNQLQELAFKNEQFNKKLIELQQHMTDIQTINNLLLYNLAKCFMLSVIRQMGWRANNHTIRKKILKSVQEVYFEIKKHPIRELLKSFITMHLINNQGVRYRSIYFAKACLTSLKRPQYQPLIPILFFKKIKLTIWTYYD